MRELDRAGKSFLNTEKANLKNNNNTLSSPANFSPTSSSSKTTTMEADGGFDKKDIQNSGSKNPKHENIICYGKNLGNLGRQDKLNLSFLINAYKDSSKKSEFFNSYFIKLAGTEDLKNQIVRGISENKIIESWQVKLNAYKEKRKKYLLYN